MQGTHEEGGREEHGTGAAGRRAVLFSRPHSTRSPAHRSPLTSRATLPRGRPCSRVALILGWPDTLPSPSSPLVRTRRSTRTSITECSSIFSDTSSTTKGEPQMQNRCPNNNARSRNNTAAKQNHPTERTQPSSEKTVGRRAVPTASEQMRVRLLGVRKLLASVTLAKRLPAASAPNMRC
jgi:hypothetical protein